jgi:hypothetical protein
VAKTVEIKIADDIEYRVIGNAFGLLIASAGLLAGEMVRNCSFDYWLKDIVPLVLASWMSFRLYRNFLSTMIAYKDAAPQSADAAASPLQSEKVVAGLISAKPGYSPEKAVEAVARRIEAQKADAVKKNKFTN